MTRAYFEKIHQSMTVAVVYITLATSLITALMLYGYFSFYENSDVAPINTVIFCLIYSSIVTILLKTKLKKFCGLLLIILYTLISVTAIHEKGADFAPAYMITGITVFIASIVLKSGFAQIISASAVVILVAAGLSTTKNPIGPDKIDDLLIGTVLLLVLSLIAWLSSSKITQLVTRISSAEKELRLKNQQLESMLDKESKAIKEMEATEVHHLYIFAKIGQTAVSLVHELINSLSILKIDIEDLYNKQKTNGSTRRIKESIQYIQNMAQNSKNSIMIEQHFNTFSVLDELRKEIYNFKRRKKLQNVKISSKITPNRQVVISGSVTSFSDTISTLLNNAQEACREVSNGGHIKLETSFSGSHLIISVSDNGPPVDKTEVKRMFEPKNSKKSSGMGIGLYLAKCIAETQLKGSMYFADKPKKTFYLKIPIN